MTSFFPHKGLDRRLFLGLGLMLVPLVVTCLLSVLLLSSAGDTYTRAGDESAKDVAVALRFRDAVQATQDYPAAVAGTGSPAAAAQFRRTASTADAAMRSLALAGFDVEEEQALAVKAARDWRTARAAGLTIVSAGRRDSLAALNAFYVPAAASQVAIGKLVASSLAERDVDQGVIARQRSRELWALIAVMLVGCLLAVSVARGIRRSIARPLGQLKTAARRMGAGDFHDRVTLQGGPELSQVADAFNTMADELRDNQAQLVHQAFHDSLTGLPNRSLLYDRAEHALARERRGQGRVSALFLDIDDFKGINDTLGHAAGDSLLVEVSRRLRAAVRAEDTVARLSGDEFAVLVEGCEEGVAVQTAERIRDILDAPFRLQGRDVSVRASIGVATSSPGSTDADELLRHADVAMYAAKAEDKGSHRVFEPHMQAELMQRMELESSLRGALANDELYVHYQPIVDLDGRSVTGIEALARWTHPQRGLVPPDEFIPIAERTGLIVPLGRRVLERAVGDLAALREALGDDPQTQALRVSVNVSAVELAEDDYVGFVESTLKAAGVPPELLVLEITERVLVEDDESTLVRLWQLKAVGVQIAVDDFGMGYSALAYVERLPLDIIKIDKAFVDSVGSSEDEADLAQVIVSLGERLGLETVAEGVEQADQGEELRRMGCRFGQGFYYARPESLASTLELLASQAPTVSAL